MAPRKATGGSARKNKTATPATSSGAEWIGGIIDMPAFATDEGEPFRLQSLFWIDSDFDILGSELAKPGEVLSLASDSLRDAIENPQRGKPQIPTRVRVATAELADALRAGHPGLEIVIAPTPEIDVIEMMMRDKMFGDSDEETYLPPGVAPEAMAAFFKSASALFRAKPWNLVPHDQCLVSVTIERFGVRDAAMSIIGQAGQSFGFLLFPGPGEFREYLSAGANVGQGGPPRIPPHLSLNFERGADLAPGMRKEVSEHRWEVADASAYPDLGVMEENLVCRPPSSEEVAKAEAIALALASVVAEDGKALKSAWTGGKRVERTQSVRTHAGEIEVTLRAPYRRAPVEPGQSDGIVGNLAKLSLNQDEHGRIDEDARAALEDELLDLFASSPEGRVLGVISYSDAILDYGANYLGHTIATLGAEDLHEVVFEIFPRKFSVEASEARTIVEETRALYSFLKREFALKQADSCLGVLGGDAVGKLEEALSDRSMFGPAKAMVMAGADAGYDIHSKEGLEAWLKVAQGKRLPPSIPVPGLPAQLSKNAGKRTKSAKAEQARKDKRKAARKARKKTR